MILVYLIQKGSLTILVRDILDHETGPQVLCLLNLLNVKFKHLRVLWHQWRLWIGLFQCLMVLDLSCRVLLSIHEALKGDVVRWIRWAQCLLIECQRQWSPIVAYIVGVWRVSQEVSCRELPKLVHGHWMLKVVMIDLLTHVELLLNHVTLIDWLLVREVPVMSSTCRHLEVMS
jgi:hypothetical protein